MRIALTRPTADNATLAEQLTKCGHEPVIAPLLTIELHPPSAAELASASALIITSRNALRAIAGIPVTGIPLFAVGSGTAVLARSLGFQSIITGPGTAEQLATYVVRERSPSAGSLLALTGEDVAYDLAGELSAQGFDVRPLTVYRSEPVAECPAVLETGLRSGKLDGIVLLSPKTARTYGTLLSEKQMLGFAARLPHFCLSSKVADALSWLDQSHKLVADLPTIEKIVARVNHAAALLQQDPARHEV